MIEESRGDSMATAVTVLFATVIYFVFALGFLVYLGFAWDWLPSPLLFLVLCDAAFAVFALAGMSYKISDDEESPLAGLEQSRAWVAYGGGAWFLFKAVIKKLLFTFPATAVSTVIEVFPPTAVAADPDAVRLMVRIAGLRGPVPVALFRHLNSDIPTRSFRRGIDAAEYLEAIRLDGSGTERRIFPGRTHAKLAESLT